MINVSYWNLLIWAITFIIIGASGVVAYQHLSKPLPDVIEIPLDIRIRAIDSRLTELERRSYRKNDDQNAH